MAAPSLRAVGSFASGTTTCTPGLPAGTAENDILVMVVECSDADTANTPTGYTALGTGIGGTTVKGAVFVKRATASESAVAANGTVNHVHAVVVGVKDADTAGSPWEIGAWGDNGVSGTMTCPGLDTNVDEAFVLQIHVITDNANDTTNGDAYTNANLTGIVEIQDQAETTGDGGGSCIASGVKATAGATGNSTATHDNLVDSVSVHLAIYPAVVPVGIPILGMAPYMPESWIPRNPQGWNPW